MKFLEKDDKDRQRRWELAERKILQKDQAKHAGKKARKRKNDEVEVTDYTEEVVSGGTKYKKVVTYVPMIDLT